MYDVSVNYVAVLVAALSNMVIGFLWYGPLFGKMWISMMGFTQKDMEKARAKGMTMQYILTYIGAAVTAYVLAHFISLLGIADAAGALTLAFWAWLGFVAAGTLNVVLWEGKSWSLWFLNVAYYFVALAVMAWIIVSM